MKIGMQAKMNTSYTLKWSVFSFVFGANHNRIKFSKATACKLDVLFAVSELVALNIIQNFGKIVLLIFRSGLVWSGQPYTRI